LLVIPKVTISILVISGVTEPNGPKFTYNIENSLPFNIKKSELQFPNPFQNASATNEGVVGITPKLVAMATSLERSGKEGRIYNLQSNIYHLVNIWWKSVQ